LTPFWLASFASQHWSTDLVRDDQILRCGRGFKECYDELINISGVPEILEDIRATFCAQLKRKKDELVNNPGFYNHEDELVRKFVDCLRE
jgi:hypothetical protein